jgi:hypothetical protein
MGVVVGRFSPVNGIYLVTIIHLRNAQWVLPAHLYRPNTKKGHNNTKVHVRILRHPVLFKLYS